MADDDRPSGHPYRTAQVILRELSAPPDLDASVADVLTRLNEVQYLLDREDLPSSDRQNTADQIRALSKTRDKINDTYGPIRRSMSFVAGGLLSVGVITAVAPLRGGLVAATVLFAVGLGALLIGEAARRWLDLVPRYDVVIKELRGSIGRAPPGLAAKMESVMEFITAEVDKARAQQAALALAGQALPLPGATRLAAVYEPLRSRAPGDPGVRVDPGDTEGETAPVLEAPSQQGKSS